jgi:tetratricopeptide (TPR) repeat protein
MKRTLAFLAVILCITLTSGSLLALQEAAPAESTLPDVQAWNEISSTVDPQVRSELALQFLENHPGSELVFSVHHLLALYYLGINDQEKFILHGEKALEGLPELPDILIHLSFVYAEGNQPGEAVKKAVRALQVVKNLPDPDEDSAIDWYSQLERLEAEANYSLGRAYLTYADQDPEKKEMNLTRSVGYFLNALQHDPRHAYASFRLGHAYSNLNKAIGAVNAYARTVAIGGRTAGPARQELARLLVIIQEAAPESDWKDKTVEGIVQAADTELAEAEKINRDTVAEKAARLTAFGS